VSSEIRTWAPEFLSSRTIKNAPSLVHSIADYGFEFAFFGRVKNGRGRFSLENLSHGVVFKPGQVLGRVLRRR